MIAGLILENAAARRPLLPFGRRLVPEELHGQIRRRATAGTSISKGCARRITIARKAFAKSGSLEFNGQNLAQVVQVSDSWVKIPIRSEALFPDLAR